jgi:hypothetical protein
MKTAVEQAVDALRLWSNAWNEFDRTGKNKPQPIEEVIAPFIQMEKKNIIMAYNNGEFNQGCNEDAEQYYNQTFKQQEQ